jgi:hypothetical protein
MFRRIPAALAAAWLAAALFLAASAAPAAALAPVAAEPAPPPAFAFTLDPATVVQILIAFVLPVLVGLVTTRATSSAVKAWLLAALSLVTSLLVELGRALAEGVTYDVGTALLAAIPAFVVSVATHYGLWKPTTVSARVQAVGRHRAND